mmetsp:Transcript_45984/g.99879  ORF Transcript_45984/g.99879 Transcript_45984/m.99879 type:complete len:490 (+) Transcript_45984:102-1571(+)|eukprot:CAMPEP_0170602090 /NCGR_PEP_ID=MMETSP0224-20130122/18208_1 /TAXON_ID=285029 /ORGANISM="Togula jolla, Strain CCCM 725" /LENGTH=489 /DNA_ID=CAMNT_0010926911 /DNA_START=47 /DNA_END=1516 /DNA_ORIENTATION=+
MARVVVLPRAEEVVAVDALEIAADHVKRAGPPAADGPPVLQAFVVCEDPRISVVPHFLSKAECRHLRDLSEGQWIRSLVGTLEASKDAASPTDEEGHAPKPAKRGTRTSQSCALRYAQTSMVESIEHRLAALAGLPVDHLERLVVVRYSPGEQFTEHHDGKFRPKTIFLYLNDLPPGDQGDTYFPHLGLSFVPREGCAVVWANAEPSGREDSRLIHAGRPPLTGVKYGVNAFFNEERMRLVRQPEYETPRDLAAMVDVRELGAKNQDSTGVIRSFVLCQEPKIVAVSQFASDDEIAHVLELAACVNYSGDVTNGTATKLPHALEAGQTPVVEQLEERLAALVGFPTSNLARLTVAETGSHLGPRNRGCGQRIASICLSERDEVFFPYIGLRFVLARGDLLLMPNAWSMEQCSESARKRVVEDLRSTRLHFGGEAGAPTLALDASFHDATIRAEQQEERLRHEKVVAGASVSVAPVAPAATAAVSAVAAA